VLVWRNHGMAKWNNKMHYYAPYKGQVPADEFVKFYNQNNTFLEEFMVYSLCPDSYRDMVIVMFVRVLLVRVNPKERQPELCFQLSVGIVANNAGIGSHENYIPIAIGT
jgi:hypothetical protein